MKTAAFSCRHIKYKIHASECTKTRDFYFKNSKIFWGGATAPPQTSSPSGSGHPLPHPLHSSPAALRSSRLRSSHTHPPLGSLATGLVSVGLVLAWSVSVLCFKFNLCKIEHWAFPSLYLCTDMEMLVEYVCTNRNCLWVNNVLPLVVWYYWFGVKNGIRQVRYPRLAMPETYNTLINMYSKTDE